MATTGYYGPGWATGTATLSDLSKITNDLLKAQAALEARLTTQAANPDTSGATLAAIEAEVNQIKAALRAVKIID